MGETSKETLDKLSQMVELYSRGIINKETLIDKAKILNKINNTVSEQQMREYLSKTPEGINVLLQLEIEHFFEYTIQYENNPQWNGKLFKTIKETEIALNIILSQPINKGPNKRGFNVKHMGRIIFLFDGFKVGDQIFFTTVNEPNSGIIIEIKNNYNLYLIRCNYSTEQLWVDFNETFETREEAEENIKRNKVQEAGGEITLNQDQINTRDYIEKRYLEEIGRQNTTISGNENFRHREINDERLKLNNYNNVYGPIKHNFINDNLFEIIV